MANQYLLWMKHIRFLSITSYFTKDECNCLKMHQTLAIANCNARMHAGFHGHSNRQILFKINALEITRLNIMALDPASNPGSKSQSLGATNCKSSTLDRLQTFKPFLAFLVNFWPLFVLFWKGISCKRNHRTFQENKQENQWFERKCPVLMAPNQINL